VSFVKKIVLGSFTVLVPLWKTGLHAKYVVEVLFCFDVLLWVVEMIPGPWAWR
jgi:hypothetical protein